MQNQWKKRMQCVLALLPLCLCTFPVQAQEQVSTTQSEQMNDDSSDPSFFPGEWIDLQQGDLDLPAIEGKGQIDERSGTISYESTDTDEKLLEAISAIVNEPLENERQTFATLDTSLSGLKKVASTTVSPYRSVCKIASIYLNEQGEELGMMLGSGVMIGEDTVLTAAHVVMSWELTIPGVTSNVPNLIAVYPAAYASSNAAGYTVPYPASEAQLVRVKSEWLSGTDVNNDLAIIKLKRPSGYYSGYLNVGLPASTSYESVSAIGYPGLSNNQLDFNQYYSTGALSQNDGNLLYSYTTKCVSGQSGGPLLNKSLEVIGLVGGMTGTRYRYTGLDATRKEWTEEGRDALKTLYRLYNPNSGEHFYTQQAAEMNMLVNLGWTYEGVGWYASSAEDGIPVYRVYNPNAGDHHYTTNKAEADKLSAIGWDFEGVKWYAPKTDTNIPIYRLYNPNAKKAGAHHYTLNAGERDNLVRLGWTYEGVAWEGNAFSS